MIYQLPSDEQKRELAKKLREELPKYGGNKRELARKIGVKHPTLLAWLEEQSLPDEESKVLLGAYFGYTNTPWEEFLQGKRDERALKIDRLVNLVAKLPPSQRDDFLASFEAQVQTWLQRHGSPSR